MTRLPQRNKNNILIIGGGASGLAAACVLAEARAPFILLEKEAKPARKLLATGNGRCNLMNVNEPVFFGDAAFAQAVLSRCGVEEVRTFFDGLGLPITEDEAGRSYPATRQANSVLDCLLAGIQQGGSGQIITDQEVIEIQATPAGFVVRTKSDRFLADRLILAGGGPAAPKLGGSVGLAQLAQGLGHRLIPFSPALCAIQTDTKELRGLSGLRLPAYLRLYHGNQVVDGAAGELLFADSGLSGLCAMQLARSAQAGLAAGQQVSIGIDLSPLLGIAQAIMRRLSAEELAYSGQEQQALALLTQRQAQLGQARMYTGLLPRQLIDKYAGQPLQKAAHSLVDWRIRVRGIRGYEQAQVAAGGLDCAQFDPATLESTIHPGLYATGELLNVDGDTGGFNLLFAWASGILAARAALG